MNPEHKALSFPHLMKIKNSKTYRRRGVLLGVPAEALAYYYFDHHYPLPGLIVALLGIPPLVAAYKHHHKLQALKRP